MGEQNNIAGEFSRLELAEHLEALAKKLRMEKVRLGDQDFFLPEVLTAKIELKGCPLAASRPARSFY